MKGTIIIGIVSKNLIWNSLAGPEYTAEEGGDCRSAFYHNSRISPPPVENTPSGKGNNQRKRAPFHLVHLQPRNSHGQVIRPRLKRKGQRSSR